MDENLAGTTNRLNACLETWQNWDAGLSAKPEVIEKLNGLSNASYLITDDNIKLVIRLNYAGRELGVDRTLEWAILTNLKASHFAPIAVHRDDALDFLVTRYVGGSHISEQEVDQYLRDIGRLFGQIHSCNVDVAVSLNPVDQAIHYYRQLPKPVEPAVSWCYEALTDRPIVPGSDQCLCHNDLLLENIIKSDSGLVAVDWEYACLGDAAFDLAVFIESYQLDSHAQQCLLDAYHGPASRALIDGYRLIYRLIEIFWWMLRDPEHPSLPDKIAGLQKRIRTTALSRPGTSTKR